MSRHRGPAGPARPRWISLVGALIATMAILVSSTAVATAAPPPAPDQPPTIWVLQPAAVSSYTQDQSVEVVWRSTVVDSGEFGVWVLSPHGDRYAETIRTPQPAGARWESLELALKSVPDGTGYRAVVAWRPTIDSGDWVTSVTSTGSFTVTGGLPRITITAPTSPATYTVGSVLKVTWTTNIEVSEGDFGVWVTRGSGGDTRVAAYVTPPPSGRTEFAALLTLDLRTDTEYHLYVGYRKLRQGAWATTVEAPATFTMAAVVPGLTAFGLTGMPSGYGVGKIDQRTRMITISVPDGTRRTALVATFTTNGAQVTVGGKPQVSGTTPNDFTYPVAYTITLADGSRQYYTVKVNLDVRVRVGSYYGGGIVVYIFKPGEPGYEPGEVHGVIAAQVDQTPAVPWALPGHQQEAVRGTSMALGAGRANTDHIIYQNGPGTGYAAGLARAFRSGGYTDWYLPSYRELQEVRAVRPGVGLSAGDYWTSTESGMMSSEAWYQNPGQGLLGTGPKSALKLVRPVRRF